MGQKTLYVIDVLGDGTLCFRTQLHRLFEQENLHPRHHIIDGIRERDQLMPLLHNSPAGLLISGSVHSVYERLPWMLELERLIVAAHQTALPVLGICFGHQIIASALGGKVERMPMREFGTFPIHFKRDMSHPYLQGFPSGAFATLTHQDHVSVLPPGAVSYGFSQLTENQIFEAGSCFGVQFHPEYDAESLRTLAKVRCATFLKERLFNSDEHLEHYLDTLAMTRETTKIVANFVRSLPVEN